jgi:hypothetical protein
MIFQPFLPCPFVFLGILWCTSVSGISVYPTVPVVRHGENACALPEVIGYRLLGIGQGVNTMVRQPVMSPTFLFVSSTCPQNTSCSGIGAGILHGRPSLGQFIVMPPYGLFSGVVCELKNVDIILDVFCIVVDVVYVHVRGKSAV